MRFIKLEVDNPAKKDSWKLTIENTTLFGITKKTVAGNHQ